MKDDGNSVGADRLAGGRLPPAGFHEHVLEGGHTFLTGRLPDDVLGGIRFGELWDLHPVEFAEIHLQGRRVKIPRWQQAYGTDYRFSGQVSAAQPVPAALLPLLAWCQATMDARLNGLLLNWYDGQLGHYIGRHRDSTHNLAPGSAIVTVSLGEERTFRLRPWPNVSGAKPVDFGTFDGSVFVLPWGTNKSFTHEVTSSRRLTGRRISVTLRAFLGPVRAAIHETQPPM